MISYPYPTLQQAEEAGLNLVPQLVGQQPRDTAAIVQDCYTLVGFGLGQGLPMPHIVQAGGDTEAQLAAALQTINRHHAAGAALNVDWKTLARLALQFLLQVLGCMLLVLWFSSSAGAAEADAAAAVAVAQAQLALSQMQPSAKGDGGCACASGLPCTCGDQCTCAPTPQPAMSPWSYNPQTGFWYNAHTGWYWHAHAGYWHPQPSYHWMTPAGCSG